MDSIPDSPSPPPCEDEAAEPNDWSLFGNSDKLPHTTDTNTNLTVFSPATEKDQSERPWLAVIDSILAAPLRVRATKIEIPIYSHYLTSRIIAVVVANDKAYHLHSSLLCRESQRFKKGLMSQHQEAHQLKIELSDETADHFAHFVDFLYKPNWEPICTEASDMVYLTELYAMGERLVAQGFQDIILRTFRNKVHSWRFTHIQLCEALEVACSSITERLHPRDDPMRDVIFWLVATSLKELQATEDFRQVLTKHRELGTQLILRAGNGTTSMPPDPFLARVNDDVLQLKGRKSKKFGALGY